MQVYIVTGGWNNDYMDGMADTEILLKDGGTSWGLAPGLPSARHYFKGISLPNGRFMVIGEEETLLLMILNIERPSYSHHYRGL